MSTTTLLTSKVTLDPGPPRIITFLFKKPYVSPIFLAVLTLTENPGLGTINGVIVAGSDPTHPGTCDLQVPSLLFSQIWDFAISHSKPSVTLTYNDSDLRVTQVSLAATQSLVASASP